MSWKSLKTLFVKLHKNERGNVMVLYVAAALILVGMLWAIIGTGARMVQKETIQSSADAAAFSAAVIKAKGMNIIAFCNLVMALLLAILMLLRLIKVALITLAAICSLACFDIFGGEVLCAFAPEAWDLETTYSNALDRLEPVIMDAMKAMAKLERAVDKTFPALSVVEAYRVGTHESYKANFGKGTLVTIAWPLPVGQDLHLPTKDGTWAELCHHGADMVNHVTQVALKKIGMPGPVASILGGAIGGLLDILTPVLCDGAPGRATTMVDTTEEKTSCSECNGADAAIYTGTVVIRNPNGTFKQFIPGETCKLDYFDSFMCPSYSGFTTCGDGREFRNLTFVKCAIKKKQPADLGGAISGDKPLPLVMADDWRSRTNVRAFSVLTDTSMDKRRQSVQIAVKTKQSSPMLNQLMGMAQAEFFAQNGKNHEDLWHMDWRARLVRFTLGNTSQTDSSAADGVPSGGADQVSGMLDKMMSSDAAGFLKDQFIIH